MKMLLSFLCVVSGGLLLAQEGSTDRQPRKPNIILIMADDLGYRELGCYGQKRIQTPHIDQMAKEGMIFTQFYAGSAVCAPTRCNLMTGRHGGNAYIRNNGEIKNPAKDRFGGQTPIPANSPCIAKTLKAAGYATGCFGKWGLGAQGTTGDPLRQGFDRFYGYNCQRNAHNLYPLYLEDDDKLHLLEGNTRGRTGKQYAPQLIADQALEFVKANKDKPFFLYYPTVIPHLPLQVTDKYLNLYKGKWPETPHTKGSYQPHDTPKACYAGMITFMDAQMGRLMALLKELKIDDHTIVMFTSDNGTTHLKAQADYEFFESVGELKGLKGQLYEGGIRVPLVVRWPGKIKPGTKSDHISAHYDLPITLSHIAGTEFDPNCDGISMVPVLTGGKQEKHEFLMWDFAGYGGQLAVRMGKWKGIKRGLQKKSNAPMELYDLEVDVSEKTDVAAANPEVVANMELILKRERSLPELEKFRFGNYVGD